MLVEDVGLVPEPIAALVRWSGNATTSVCLGLGYFIILCDYRIPLEIDCFLCSIKGCIWGVFLS